MPQVSVIVPARNEQDFLPGCLESITTAAERANTELEIVVVLNRCTDNTESIASDAGCTLAYEDAKNLSLIRNAGAAIATGDIIVTIDADSRMAPGSLEEILGKLETGKFIGGGSIIKPERYSLGILATSIVAVPYIIRHGFSFGMFWCEKRYFDEIGGFNPEFVSVEDVDFATRLRALGKTKNLRFGTVWKHPITTSCRKFDLFGDWHLVRDREFIRRAFTGTDQENANRYWYDAR